MRSTLLYLALSLPATAFAAPTYSSPLRNMPSHAKPAAYQQVAVDFFNSTTAPCDLHIKDAVFSVPAFRSVRLRVPVSSEVSVTSQYNSHFRKVVLATEAKDDGRTVLIR